MPRILMLGLDPALAGTSFEGLDRDTELDVRVVPGRPAGLSSAQDWSLADLAVMAAGQEAQAEGFDALCLPDFGDYGVGALRSLLDIPVIAGGRGAMLHALTLGAPFAVVTPRSGYERAARLVHDYGLSAQCAAVEPYAGQDADQTLSACHAALAAGAKVLCFAEMPAASAARLAAQLPVPALLPAPLSLKLAESFLGLGLSQSRRAYPEPQIRKPELIRALMAAAAGH